MRILKYIVFFFLLPLYLPLSLLINATYDWWVKQAERNKIIYFLLMPIYGPGALFLLWSFEWWVKLLE
jgi:hypothetical protein